MGGNPQSKLSSGALCARFGGGEQKERETLEKKNMSRERERQQTQCVSLYPLLCKVCKGIGHINFSNLPLCCWFASAFLSLLFQISTLITHRSTYVINTQAHDTAIAVHFLIYAQHQPNSTDSVYLLYGTSLSEFRARLPVPVTVSLNSTLSQHQQQLDVYVYPVLCDLMCNFLLALSAIQQLLWMWL